jgi:hypothetical protein
MAASGRHKGRGGGRIIETSFPRDKHKSLCGQGIGHIGVSGMLFAIYGGTTAREPPP